MLLHRLQLLTAHLVVAVVALVAIGGATRVMEAGLACPDWPLCYGVLLPGRQMNLQVFLEWFHRLDAFLVGIALLVLAVVSAVQRRRLPSWLPWLSFGALLLVALQGGLGALTVLALLDSSVVTAHLATALVLVLLLSAAHQLLSLTPQDAIAPQSAPLASARPAPPLPRWWLPLMLIPVGLVFSQCLLGGAMASQWAADRCFSSGDGCAWLAAHRLGAYPAAAGVLLLALAALWLPAGHRHLQGLVSAAVVLVALQVVLGITTLRMELAVPALTIAHQLVAALLIALMGAVLGRSLAPLPNRRFLEIAHG